MPGGPPPRRSPSAAGQRRCIVCDDSIGYEIRRARRSLAERGIGFTDDPIGALDRVRLVVKSPGIQMNHAVIEAAARRRPPGDRRARARLALVVAAGGGGDRHRREVDDGGAGALGPAEGGRQPAAERKRRGLSALPSDVRRALRASGLGGRGGLQLPGGGITGFPARGSGAHQPEQRTPGKTQARWADTRPRNDASSSAGTGR